MIRILLLSFMLMPFTASHAIDESGNYAVWGVGKKSCFHYNKARENDAHDNYTSYIKGFITAINITEPDTYSISGSIPFNKILEWIDDTCELKQTHSLEQTLLQFVEEHYESRSRRARRGVGR
ncbi:MAG: hypothetical protein MI673_10050 [Thiotrichales bacterium]|nr:hypothetical protein [Thiotrichales bacterium]